MGLSGEQVFAAYPRYLHLLLMIEEARVGYGRGRFSKLSDAMKYKRHEVLSPRREKRNPSVRRNTKETVIR